MKWLLCRWYHALIICVNITTVCVLIILPTNPTPMPVVTSCLNSWTAMRRSDAFFQGAGGDTPQGGGVLNVANDSFYTAMNTILNETAAIFKSSPYFHIGCDETGTPTSLPGYAKFATEHGINGSADLFAYYVKTMADSVTALGKKAIVWGPASLTRLKPGDAVVMVWQGGDGPAVTAMHAVSSHACCYW